MSSRHQPLNGADSAEAWNPRPYKVLACDRYDEDDRFTIRVKAAIGPYDARSQARIQRPDASVLMVTEATEEEAARWAAEDRIDAEAKGAA